MTRRRTLASWVVVAVVAAMLLVVAPVGSAADIRGGEWPLQTLKANAVWGITRGQGITVAVLDTGVQANHPDLVGQVLPGADFVDGATADGRTDTDPVNSHGTAMASIIAGSGQGNGGDGMMGLAPAVKVLPIRVFAGQSAVNSQESSQDVSRGIDYAVAHGAQVINISLGGPTDYPFLKASVEAALEHNVVVVAASGDGGQQDNFQEYPASYSGVIDVGAVDQNGQVASFSSRGPGLSVTAPGVQIYDAHGSDQYGFGYGTSQATAYTSAAVALVRSKYPSYTAGQVEDLLIHTADHKGASPRDDAYGYGIIDPYAALTTSYVPPADANPLGIGGAGPAPTYSSQFTIPQSTVLPVPVPVGPASPSVSSVPQAGGSSGHGGGGLGTAALAGITVGAVAVAGAAFALVGATRRRRRRAASAGPPPGQWPPPGGWDPGPS